MNILILTSSNPKTSAGIVAYDLLNGLSSIKGNNVKILVRAFDIYNDNRIIPIQTKAEHYLNKIIRFYKRVIRKTLKIIYKKYQSKEELIRASYFSDFCFENSLDETKYSTKKILRKAGFKPEIVLVLFMQQFISFRNLYELNEYAGASIFLYLMDMAPFTGGCHYAWDCIEYTKECENCKAVNLKHQNHQPHLNYIFKMSYLEKTKVSVVAASEWQYNQLMKSSLFKDKEKFKLLLPINENLFYPADKIEARKELGLPVDKKIIFFGAVTLDEKRKGSRELIDALQILFKKSELPGMIHLAIAGNNSFNFKDSLLFSHSLLGYLDHNKLAKAYQAADVCVSPSIEDSGPMMINQSIMSGTPVVSFKTGVATDLIHNNETGYIANLKDTNDFADGIKYILELNDNDYREMSAKCRKTGIYLCSQQKKCEELLEIFNNQLCRI